MTSFVILHIVRILVVVCLFPSVVLAKETKIALLVMVGDSGIERIEMQEPQKILIARLAQMAKFPGLKDASLEFFSGANGASLWVGTAQDLRKGQRVEALIEQAQRHPKRCSDLVAAFRKLATRLRQLEIQGYTHIIVITYMGLIHTGYPCDQVASLTLPQLPPHKINWEQLFQRDSIRALVMLSVNEFQEVPYLETLEAISVQYAQQNKIFKFHTEPQTLSVLGEKFRWLIP